MIDEMIAELRNTHWKNSGVRRPDKVQRGALLLGVGSRSGLEGRS